MRVRPYPRSGLFCALKQEAPVKRVVIVATVSLPSSYLAHFFLFFVVSSAELLLLRKCLRLRGAQCCKHVISRLFGGEGVIRSVVRKIKKLVGTVNDRKKEKRLYRPEQKQQYKNGLIGV